MGFCLFEEKNFFKKRIKSNKRKKRRTKSMTRHPFSASGRAMSCIVMHVVLMP